MPACDICQFLDRGYRFRKSAWTCWLALGRELFKARYVLQYSLRKYFAPMLQMYSNCSYIASRLDIVFRSMCSGNVKNNAQKSLQALAE